MHVRQLGDTPVDLVPAPAIPGVAAASVVWDAPILVRVPAETVPSNPACETNRGCDTGKWADNGVPFLSIVDEAAIGVGTPAPIFDIDA